MRSKLLTCILVLFAFVIAGFMQAEPAMAADSKPKNEYNITINYELGMHCTGFDFTY